MVLIEELKKIKSDAKELRKFGISFGIVLAVLGSLWLWKEKPFYIYFYIGSAAVLVSGFLCPPVLRPIHKVLFAVVVIIRLIATTVGLIGCFYLIFTPMSIIARLAGKHFLDQKINPAQKSYWIKRAHKEFRASDYERQF